MKNNKAGRPPIYSAPMKKHMIRLDPDSLKRLLANNRNLSAAVRYAASLLPVVKS